MAAMQRDTQRRSDAISVGLVIVLLALVLPAVLDPFHLNLMS